MDSSTSFSWAFDVSDLAASFSVWMVSSKSFLRFSKLRRTNGFLSRRITSVPEARKTELELMTALLALKFATRYCLFA